MKIRNDFVTNSSSSSFVVVFEMPDTKEVWDKLRNDFGEFGVTTAKQSGHTYEDISTKGKYYEEDDYFEYCFRELYYLDPGIFKENHLYFFTNCTTYTSEGDKDSADYIVMSRFDEAKIVYEENN